MKKVIDLFAGCGGMTLGFQKAGFEIISAFDNWEPCVNVYRSNFKHPIYLKDIRKESTQKMIIESDPDIVIGGPPCQDFSSAGKRKESDRADLTVVYSKVITKVCPQYFVMENVRRAKKSNALAKARKILRDAGYYSFETVLDASKCGVPQKRLRYFMIGSKKPHIENISSLLIKKQTAKRMTVRDYLGDSLGTDYFYRHPRSYKRRGIFSIDEPSPTVRGVNRPISKNYKKHKNDKSHPDDARALTTYERSLIQTFPKDFKWYGTKTDKELMIGNAVPVHLAQFVAQTLQQFMELDKKESINFSQADLVFD